MDHKEKIKVFTDYIVKISELTQDDFEDIEDITKKIRGYVHSAEDAYTAGNPKLGNTYLGLILFSCISIEKICVHYDGQGDS